MKNFIQISIYFIIALFVAGVIPGNGQSTDKMSSKEMVNKRAKALFAEGCFWCMEKPF